MSKRHGDIRARGIVEIAVDGAPDVEVDAGSLEFVSYRHLITSYRIVSE